MLENTLVTYFIPFCIYSVMGVFIARIQLAGSTLKNISWLRWLQISVDFLRIVFMWPLVLFIEKSKAWLENTSDVETSTPPMRLK